MLVALIFLHLVKYQSIPMQETGSQGPLALAQQGYLHLTSAFYYHGNILLLFNLNCTALLPKFSVCYNVLTVFPYENSGPP